MSVPWVPLGEVLQSSRHEVAIDPAAEYRKVGLRGFGRGLFEYESMQGQDLGRLRFFELSPDRVVVSNIKAWEGAVATTTAGEKGRIVSNRFLQYESTTASLRYVAHWLLSAGGLQALRAASPGSADRNRTLSADRFESIVIPLPPRPQQDRIAAHLDAIERALVGHTEPGRPGALAAHASAEMTWLRGFNFVPLAELVHVGPSPERVPSEEEVAFVPMSALSAETGVIDRAEYRPRSRVGAGFRQFTRGDIVFARITPSMQNGKSAIFNDPRVRVGYGSTEFHVLRPKGTTDTRWLWAVIRTRWFRELASRSFAGTAGQQRVPADFLREVQVPLPSPDAIESATSRLLASQSTLTDLLQADRRAHSLRAALLPAARNEIFASMV